MPSSPVVDQAADECDGEIFAKNQELTEQIHGYSDPCSKRPKQELENYCKEFYDSNKKRISTLRTIYYTFCCKIQYHTHFFK